MLYRYVLLFLLCENHSCGIMLLTNLGICGIMMVGSVGCARPTDPGQVHT